MCYSAMEDEALRWLSRHGESDAIRRESLRELLRRQAFPNDSRITIRFTRALEAFFERSNDPADAEIAALFARIRAGRRRGLESGLFAQRARLARAERALALRETKKALEEKRIAGGKIDWHMRQLADFDRKDLRESDRRIYPMWYTLVLANVDGKRAVMPMRYHCRQNGKPAGIDRQYDGLYNARRDNLEGYWKNLWGRRHAIMVACAFYENVALESYEHRALRPGEKSQNLVLEFKPQAAEPMLLACLWDHWQKPGEPDLYSFSAITDEPPPEIAATGHDRCPIPIKPEHLDAWLTPEGRGKEELQAILDDRVRHTYEHRKAA